MYKKHISSQLLQLALIVSLLRLDPELYLNSRWTGGPEVREILLGPSSAYTQTHFHNLRNRLSQNGYLHPKSVDAALYGGNSIFAELDALDRYNRFRDYHCQQDVIAYLVSGEGIPPTPQQTPVPGNGHGSFGSETRPAIAASPEGASVSRTEENSSYNSIDHHTGESTSSSSWNYAASELTREDMDLIEILWKQDIDLGVSRDVFDIRANQESEKQKVEHLAVKEDKYNQQEAVVPDVSPSPIASPWNGINYTIDSETGEHIVHEPLPVKNDDELGDSDLEQLAEELQNLQDVLQFLDPETCVNYTQAATASRADPTPPVNEKIVDSFSPPLISVPDYSEEDDLPENEDTLISQLEQLENFLKKVQEKKDDRKGVDMYPNVEECWQDLAATLPLPGITSPNQSQGTCNSTAPISRPGNGYFAPTLSAMPTTESTLDDSYGSVLLQNASLAPLVPDINGTFSYAPTTACIGSSNIGTAVASSLAALSNGSEPMGGDNMMGATYGNDLSEFMCPNNSSAAIVSPQGEYLLSDLLSDEDLQLMDMASPPEVNYQVPVTVPEDKMEMSRDSAVSSMGSDRVPSLSDGEWIDSCSETSSHHEERKPSFSLELAHPLVFPGGLEAGTVQHPFAPRGHPAVAQKKYKLFGRRLPNITNSSEESSNGFTEYSEDEPAAKNPHFLPFHGSGPRGAFPFVDGTTASDAIGHSFYGGRGISGCGYTDPFQHNHTYHMPVEGSSTNPKPIVRDKLKKQASEDSMKTKDEKRARSLKVPISIDDIINLPIDEFNERMSKHELTETQLTLIRDIRRRGKNKVAAQNCRKRKLDQIINLQQELDSLQAEKSEVEEEYDHLIGMRRLAREKFSQLYQFVFRGVQPPPPGPPDFSLQLTNAIDDDPPYSLPSNSSSFDNSSESDRSKGARMKRKTDKK